MEVRRRLEAAVTLETDDVEGVSLRAQDIVLCLAMSLCASLLLFYGRGQAGWGEAAATYAAIGISPLVFRALEHRFPSTATHFFASFLPPAAGVVLFYGHLDPLCDLLNPHLADAKLARIDLLLFGHYPGIWLEQHLPPSALTALFLCYTSYYLWPVSIGLILYAYRRFDDFDRYVLGYVLFMLGSYACYLAVPAIGPRFYLVDQYSGPIHATLLGSWFETLYRGSPYFRDCFPSGHTGLTLYCLYNARRLTPRWFKVMLLPGIGLITSTVACRFHYAVDLLAAPILTVSAIFAADALHRELPRIRVFVRTLLAPAYRSVR